MIGRRVVDRSEMWWILGKRLQDRGIQPVFLELGKWLQCGDLWKS